MNPAHAPYHAPFAALVIICSRVGGGNTRDDSGLAKRMPLSPRGRGKHAYNAVDALLYRSIPACGRGNPYLVCGVVAVLGSIPASAGEASLAGGCQRTTTVYPRIDGGETALHMQSVALMRG